MTKEEELGIGKDRRRVDINEEYYRLAAKVGFKSLPWGGLGKLKSSRRIWTIGKTKESKDYPVRMMGYDVSCRIWETELYTNLPISMTTMLFGSPHISLGTFHCSRP